MVERRKAKHMQHGLERDIRLVGQRVAQRHGAMSGKFRDQPIGQRSDSVVFFRRFRVGIWRAARADDGTLHRQLSSGRLRSFSAGFNRLGPCFVLRPNKAALDTQRAFVIDADKGAGSDDFGRIVADGPIFEDCKRTFDFAKPLVDFFGQFVGFGILFFQRFVLCHEGVVARLLVLGEFCGLAKRRRRPAVVAIREIGRECDPFPAFGAQCLRPGLKLFGDQPIEQRRILQPAAVVVLKQIPHHNAASGLVDVDADESSAAVRGANRAFDQLAANAYGSLLKERDKASQTCSWRA